MPAVRLEALGAVCNMKSGKDVHAPLLDALEHDTNAGVRVGGRRRLWSITRKKEGCDAPTARALEHLAITRQQSLRPAPMRQRQR